MPMGENKITFYMNPQSRSRIVRWMLEELGAPYESEVISFGKEMKSEPYVSINPMGKVPAIEHNGKVVTECAAICAYLADAFPQAQLAPAIDDRADYYRWLFFAAGPLEAAVLNKSLGLVVPKDREATAGYGNFESTINTLSKAISNSGYIAGERFTAADVYVGSQIAWGLQFQTIPERPEFRHYVKRICERSAYLRATELDNALLTKTPTRS